MKKVQNKMKKMKGAQAAGVQVTSLLEMKQFLTPIRIPICIPYVDSCTDLELEVEIHMDTKGIHMDSQRYTQIHGIHTKYS